MIRPANDDDTDVLIDIWLSASRIAHSFIPYDFWLNGVDDMKTVYLPNAETYVIEVGNVLGFLSLVDNHVAGLFVDPTAQGLGYGMQLLTFAQSKRRSLSLNVYSQNNHAVAFYRKHGFRVVEERREPASGEPELVMEWGAADG